jgi:hypothetical protein
MKFRRRAAIHAGRLVFVMLLSFASAENVVAREPLELVAEQSEPAVVQIRAFDGDGKTLWNASGFFATPQGLVVSNAHILGGGERSGTRREVVTHEKQRYPITRVLAQDREADVAIAEVTLPQGVKVPYLRFALTKPRLAQRVLVIGNPKGLGWTASDGIVASVRNLSRTEGLDSREKSRKSGGFIQYTAPTTRGSSGSPVIDMEGEVIGVHARTRRDLAGAHAQIHWASPASNVFRLVLPDGREVGQMLRGLYLTAAVAQFDKETAFARTGKERCLAHVKVATAYVNQRRFTKAVDHLKEAIREDPGNLKAHYTLGLSYLRLEEKKAFEAQCRILEDIDPKAADDLRGLSESESRQMRKRESNL